MALMGLTLAVITLTIMEIDERKAMKQKKAEGYEGTEDRRKWY